MIHRFAFPACLAWLLLAVPVFGGACGPSLPRAGSPEAAELARVHVSRGQHEYSIGRFVAAIDEYTLAYDLYPSPVLLFNIGQCHREMRNYDRAIFFYTGYLRDEPNAPNRAVVEQLIAEARAAEGPSSGATGTRPR